MSLRAWVIAAVALWLMLLVSAVYLVKVRHQARLQFIELQSLMSERDDLATEWSQLQIEQSALASHARIDRLARQKFNLRQPGADDVIILRPREDRQ